MVRPDSKRSAAHHLIKEFDVSERRAAKVLGLHRATMRYKAHPRDDSHLIDRMKAIVNVHRRFGLPRVHYLLRREGSVRSRSRTERVYRAQGLQIKNRRRKKMKQVVRVPFDKAIQPKEIWSFDFVMDRSETNRALKCLTVVDDCSKRSPLNELFDHGNGSHKLF